ncbi:MAG TPA: hypothetical protein VD962_06145 [Rubricoccaceae bacterium]|nr:hypothetical protein [Rubricoccaceae bacterium]
MNALLFLLTVGVLLLAVAALLFGRRIGRPRLAQAAALAATAWVALYALALVSVSLSSRERVLRVGERQAFCGFYLDCHMGLAVERVETAVALGDQQATGRFYVVTLRVSSDARRATLRLGGPALVVRDAEGRTYRRDRAAEHALAAEGRPTTPLTREVAAGGSFLTTVVFDLPPGADEPRLVVTDARGVDRVIESVLIGDEDSFLHARTVHALHTSA